MSIKQSRNAEVISIQADNEKIMSHTTESNRRAREAGQQERKHTETIRGVHSTMASQARQFLGHYPSLSKVPEMKHERIKKNNKNLKGSEKEKQEG